MLVGAEAGLRRLRNNQAALAGGIVMAVLDGLISSIASHYAELSRNGSRRRRHRRRWLNILSHAVSK